ncbi:MAG: hypothetical protein Q8K32_03125 [Archangium sp.]|nr:hypothetical protein [Archangium sp.]
MRKAIIVLVLLTGCVETRSVAVTFGDDGEGLDGFMCKDRSTDAGVPLLARLPADGRASLVVDFIRLGGVPGCRSGQLVKWCASHKCEAIQSTRSCLEVTLPQPGGDREEFRKKLLDALRAAGPYQALADAPDEFVLVRVVGTTQACDSVLPAGGDALPLFDKSKLVGCAYSCPVLLEKVEQDVYLGFDTFDAFCEKGVGTCSDGELHWQP